MARPKNTKTTRRVTAKHPKRTSFRKRFTTLLSKKPVKLASFIVVFAAIGVGFLMYSRANALRIYCPLDRITFSSWTPGHADKWQSPARSNHWGVDINEWNSGYTGGAQRGAPIRAAFNGRVKTAGLGSGAGYHVEIVGTDGKTMFRYLHMDNKPSVSVNQNVSAGQILGYVGSRDANTVHLHFDYRTTPSNTKSAATAPDPLPLLRTCYRGSNPGDSGANSGYIQGVRVNGSNETIQLVDGPGGVKYPSAALPALPGIAQSYRASGLPAGGYRVRITVPSNKKLRGYTACINAQNCHNSAVKPAQVLKAGTADAVVQVPKNGYVDLYWHFDSATVSSSCKKTFPSQQIYFTTIASPAVPGNQTMKTTTAPNGAKRTYYYVYSGPARFVNHQITSFSIPTSTSSYTHSDVSGKHGIKLNYAEYFKKDPKKVYTPKITYYYQYSFTGRLYVKEGSNAAVPSNGNKPGYLDTIPLTTTKTVNTSTRTVSGPSLGPCN